MVRVRARLPLFRQSDALRDVIRAVQDPGGISHKHLAKLDQALGKMTSDRDRGV